MLALINDVTHPEALLYKRGVKNKHKSWIIETFPQTRNSFWKDREEAVGVYFAANNLMSLTFLVLGAPSSLLAPTCSSKARSP